MRKLILIIFGAIFVTIAGFLFFIGFQVVSTNKSIYSVGEEVFVTWSDFRLYRCSCMGPELEFYQETINGWEKIELHLPYGRVACVNGIVKQGPFPCDLFICRLAFSMLSGNYTWNSKIYEFKGETETCEVPAWLKVEFPILSYDLLTAPPGKYKVKFGIAEKVFEIR